MSANNIHRYLCGDLVIRRSVTSRRYHWKDPDGDTGYISSARFHLLRMFGVVRRIPTSSR
jgi:hypothetical protein